MDGVIYIRLRRAAADQVLAPIELWRSAAGERSIAHLPVEVAEDCPLRVRQGFNLGAARARVCI